VQKEQLIIRSKQDREKRGFKYLIEEITPSIDTSIMIGQSYRVEDATCSEGILSILFSKQPHPGIAIR
jgi:hypothetical protein